MWGVLYVHSEPTEDHEFNGHLSLKTIKKKCLWKKIQYICWYNAKSGYFVKCEKTQKIFKDKNSE